jgi:hypothetical protein
MEEKSKENSNFPLFAWAKKRKEIGGGEIGETQELSLQAHKIFSAQFGEGRERGH